MILWANRLYLAYEYEIREMACMAASNRVCLVLLLLSTLREHIKADIDTQLSTTEDTHVGVRRQYDEGAAEEEQQPCNNNQHRKCFVFIIIITIIIIIPSSIQLHLLLFHCLFLLWVLQEIKSGPSLIILMST